MMRRTMCALAFVSAAAMPVSAQMPPSIKGPIDAAKRQANKTSAQINNEQKVGNDPGSKTSPAASNTKGAGMPAAAAQSAAQNGAAAKVAPSPDSAQKRGSVTQSGSKGTVTFYRETFSFDGGGRRDPFLSLMASGELRPMISDLTLVGIIYDESGRNSVAVLVDASAGGQTYRKKLGDQLGRMKVTKISENSITLNVDEFGFGRQETLLIDRNPRTGPRRPQ
jgi:hypothetical protein